jgi:protein SCO1
MQNLSRKPISLAVAILIFAAALTCRANPATAAATGVRGGSVWGAGYFPDAPLVSQDGKNVRFFSDLLQGKVVVINFMFTRDPAEGGVETARLREVQKILGDRVGRDIFFYSISIDPNDTPKMLKAYADKFQVGPGWLFLSGKEDDVTQLRKKLGVYRGEKGEKLEDFETRLLIGNQATGQWMKLSPFENPYILASKIGGSLYNYQQPTAKLNSYADAPKVREPSMGEGLFRTDCATCHTIGTQHVTGSDTGSLGPDLFGVTRKRDTNWLARLLAEPDKMIAEKDPLVMELMAKYRNLPMPKAGLTSVEIQALLSYLEEETSRVENQNRPLTDHNPPAERGYGKMDHH